MKGRTRTAIRAASANPKMSGMRIGTPSQVFIRKGIANLLWQCSTSYSMSRKALRKQTLFEGGRKFRELSVDGSTPFDTVGSFSGTFESQTPHPVDQGRARNA